MIFNIPIQLDLKDLAFPLYLTVLYSEAPKLISKTFIKSDYKPEAIRNFYPATKAKLLLCTSPLTLAGAFNIISDSDNGFLIVSGDCIYKDFDKCEQHIKNILSALSGIKNIKVTSRDDFYNDRKTLK
jgi:hypothetical protein